MTDAERPPGTAAAPAAPAAAPAVSPSTAAASPTGATAAAAAAVVPTATPATSSAPAPAPTVPSTTAGGPTSGAASSPVGTASPAVISAATTADASPQQPAAPTPAAEPPAHSTGHAKVSLASLALGALGVVFGDIGTSPLYTLHECLREVTAKGGGVAPTPEDVLGVLSLIFWSLTMVVTVKYLSFVMRADNHGEGGIFALLAVVPERLRLGSNGTKISFVAGIVVVGAALLYGDGAITPAISVLSALEGITVLKPEWAGMVVPATCLILLGLFAVQSRGTGSVGAAFGPIMLVWFLTIAGLGIYHLAERPDVLWALVPSHAVGFFLRHGMPGLLVLGSVVLAVTGGEALYADMGHFGARPIRLSWLGLVMPALVLCYFGQGAMVLAHPETIENPFFSLVPTGKATVFLIILSSVATVIASQALISGAFSLTRQAQQLGYFPRVTIRHTAAHTEGQIYIPQINWLLAVACLLLVVGFQKSERLASAYGIAVTGTMMLTSFVYYEVMRATWKWSLPAAGAVLLLFLSFDVPFFLSNTVKILDGGWVPVAIGVAFVAAMLIWSKGRNLILEQYSRRFGGVEEALKEIEKKAVARVPGTAIFMASNTLHTPPVLVHFVERTRSLHQRVILLTVVTEPIPTVPPERRVQFSHLGGSFSRLVARYGFMEQPNVPEVVHSVGPSLSPPIDEKNATYFLGRESVLGANSGAMGGFAEGLFGFLQRNAVAADRVFRIPPEQVIEIGIQIDL